MGVIDYESCANLPAMFFEQAAKQGEAPFLWRKSSGRWTSQSWREIAGRVERMARGLLSLGLKDGERVLLLSENRAEWLIADLAIMAAGGVTVPAYVTNTVADTLHILSNADVRMAIVSTRTLAERLIAAGLQARHAPLVIAIEPLNLRQNPGLEFRQWDDVMAMGATRQDDIAARVRAIPRNGLACLIYTSGTGGAPKGVMLSHGAIIANAMGAYHLLLTLGVGQEVFLCFLPLSHSYEHTAGQFFPISIGAQIHYAESVEQLVSNMAEVRPTIMTAVPRLYEMMRLRILSGVERTGGFKARLFRRAVALGSLAYEKPGTLTIFERLENLILDFMVRRKVAKRFGGRLKAIVSGGAPLNYEVGLFFKALKVPILQGYGQTEAAPVISANPPLKVKLHTVGPPVKGVEARIADDGEICVRGEMVMLGYWEDPETTALVIRDGWLHTGDVGVIDEDGYIEITDRKKDLIVNSGGDNVSPQRVEGFLTLHPAIAQAMVYGDGRPHLVALLVPDPEHAAAWAAGQGKATDLKSLVEDADFRRHVGEALDRINKDLSPIEKIRRFVLSAEAFTVDNEMATPTLKIRRHAILARYRPVLDELYDDRKG